MLGRYVAGTLLVLGAAMLMMPQQQPETAAALAPQVTRTESATSALATPQPIRVPAPEADSRPAGVTITPVPSLAAPQESLPTAPRDLIEQAVAEADGTAQAAPEKPIEIAGIAALAGLEETASATVAPDADPDVMFVSGSRVNVRSGPSTDFNVISSVLYGDAVEVVALDDNGWAEIRLVENGARGYMASRFLDASLGN